MVQNGPTIGVNADARFPKPVSAAVGGVDVPTGAFRLSSTDLSLGGAWPLSFTRGYNSEWQTDGQAAGPFGPGWSTNWQASLSTDQDSDVTISVPAGSFTFGYNPNNPYSYTPPKGTNASLVALSDPGHGYKYLLTTADQTQYLFRAATLQSVSDRVGNTWNLTYSNGLTGNLTSITAPTGRSISLTWTGSVVTQLSDGLGRTVSYGYTSGLLTSVTDVRGHTWTYHYNTAYQLVSLVDPTGSTSTCPHSGSQVSDEPLCLTYDSQGRVATLTDAAGYSLSYSYGVPAAGATQVTDQRGHVWEYDYAPSLVVTGAKDPYGKVAAQTLDVDNNVALAVNPDGQTTSAAYDSFGNVLTVVDPLGYEVTNTYDSWNDLLTTTNQDGDTTTYTYDSTKHYLTQVQDAYGHSTTYSVNTANGLVNSVTDPNNHVVSFTYDTTAGRVGDKLSSLDAYSNATTYTYDAVGRQLSVTTPAVFDAGTGTAVSHTSSVTYDNAGDVLTSTVPINLPGHSTATTTTTYDAYGRPLTVQDPNGNTWTNTYDPRGLLLTVQDPVNGAGHLTSYGYDAAGNRTSVTDANGSTTTYTFDSDNRPLTVSIPTAGGATTIQTLTYDAAGQVLTSTDGKGQQTSFTYTLRGELATVAYAGSPGTVTYTYAGAGQRLSMADSTGVTSYTYDRANRLTQVSFPGNRTVGYGYDAAGNRTQLTYPGGSSVSYSYDNDERLASLTDWLNNQTRYSYDAAGRLSTTTLPASSGGNSVVGTNLYFGNNALQSVSWNVGGTALASATYTIDRDANRTSRTTSFSGSGSASNQTEGYCYDGLNRLTAVYGTTTPSCGAGSPTQTFSYDRVGNRTAMTNSAGTTSYSYDGADRLLSVTPPGSGATTYSYDGNGAVTARGSDTFTWDTANRLTAATVSRADPETMTYNGDGLRQTRTDSTTGGTTAFVWDLSADTPVVLDDGSQYLYGAGLVEQIVNGTPFYFLADGLGSTVAIIDGSGTMQQTYGYDVYGKSTAGVNSHPSEYQFAGQEMDPDSLQYLRARYYDPTTGRFLSRDPLSASDPVGHQPYSYASNNPATASDPSGLDTLLHNPCTCGPGGTMAYTEQQLQCGGCVNSATAAAAQAAVDDPTPANVAVAEDHGLALDIHDTEQVQAAEQAEEDGLSSEVDVKVPARDGYYLLKVSNPEHGKIRIEIEPHPDDEYVLGLPTYWHVDVIVGGSERTIEPDDDDIYWIALGLPGLAGPIRRTDRVGVGTVTIEVIGGGASYVEYGYPIVFYRFVLPAASLPDYPVN